MTDSSPVIPWLFAFVGLALSLVVGRMMRGPKGFGGIVAAAILATILGTILTLATVYTHDACTRSLHACQSRGDGNMSYWFHSFFAIPIFWIAMSMFGSSEPLVLLDLAPYDTTVVAALTQFKQRIPVTESCPDCGSLVAVERLSASRQAPAGLVRASCKCGKCSGTFELGVTSA